jgi:hypothetical protein
VQHLPELYLQTAKEPGKIRVKIQKQELSAKTVAFICCRRNYYFYS